MNCTSRWRSEPSAGIVAMAVIGDGRRGLPIFGTISAPSTVKRKATAMAGSTIAPPYNPASQPPVMVDTMKASEPHSRILP